MDKQAFLSGYIHMVNWKTFIAAAMLAGAPLVLAAPAHADDFPLAEGDLTEVSGIFIHDGGSVTYANYLADQWRKQQEFAKSKGWISDYHIYSNLNARDGEPNIYLYETFSSVPTAAENARRLNEWERFDPRTNAQQNAASSDRAKIRTLKGTMLLREMKPR